MITEKLNLKCPYCDIELQFVDRIGKLLNYMCPNVDCYYEIDVYEKTKSNNPKIKDGKIIKGEYDESKISKNSR